MANTVVPLQSGTNKFQLFPFSTAPLFGVVENDATVVFDVKLSPANAQHYTADFVCDILFVTQIPTPTISASGISRLSAIGIQSQ